MTDTGFKTGDVVVLKSGSPKMVVNGSPSLSGEWIDVVWIDSGGVFHHANIHRDCLLLLALENPPALGNVSLRNKAIVAIEILTLKETVDVSLRPIAQLVKQMFDLLFKDPLS